MDEAVCTVDKVEELTGIDFFPELDDKIERKVEAKVSMSEWNHSLKTLN
jgi:endonuclease G